MALKKSTKRFFIIVLLFFIAPGALLFYWFKLRTLTDKNGDKWKLDRMAGMDAEKGGYPVLKNGTFASGYLASISIGTDGLLHGTQSNGKTYYWLNYWREG